MELRGKFCLVRAAVKGQHGGFRTAFPPVSLFFVLPLDSEARPCPWDAGMAGEPP